MPIDMLEHIFPMNGQMYPLVGAGSNETCRARVMISGYRYFDKNENWEEGWGDEQYVYRAFDISSYRNNEVYCLWTKLADGKLRYGNPWIPRCMDIGQVFKRTAYVIHYDAQGHITQQAQVVTWIKLVAYHASKTFASGRTVLGVAELQYGFTPDVSDVREHYFYGKGHGLVGFEDGVISTYIGQGTPTSIKPQTVIPWINALRPAVPPTEAPVTPPTPPHGSPVPMRVTATAGLKLRTVPNGDVIRIMPLGEAVTAYPDTATPSVGFTWLQLVDAKGNTGWSADTYLTPVAQPPAPVAWTVNLSVPYVSQIDANSAKSNNDCGLASLLMQVRYWMTRHSLSAPSVPSVDDLFRYTVLAQANPPSGLTFAQLEQLAAKLGYKTSYAQPASMDWIAQQLRDDKPVMVLLDYSVFNPAGAKIAHLAIVKGYNADSFLCADPYLAGDNYVISRAQLNEAMRSSPGNNLGYQAMVLAV